MSPKKFIFGIGLGVLVTYMVTFLVIWIFAFMQPEHQAIVSLNAWGEVYWELFLIIATMPFVAAFIGQSLDYLKKLP